MATSRLRLVSSARYTSPMPPWPIFSKTLKWLIVSPIKMFPCKDLL